MQFVVPHKENNIWTTYVYDTNSKKAYMVDCTTMSGRTMTERHQDKAETILKSLFYSVELIRGKPEWDVKDWEFLPGWHGRKEIKWYCLQHHMMFSQIKYTCSKLVDI